MENAKNLSCFCLKKLNHLSITYKSFTNAVTPVRNIFKFFQTNKKLQSIGFCCFLFLNYGKNGLPRITRLMAKASLRLSEYEWYISKKTFTKTIFLFKI